MIEYSQKETQLKITIPLSGIQELCDYKNGTLGVLKNIEIDDCSRELVDNLKSVYKLLEQLELDERFLSQNKDSIPDYKD